jgi:regulator of sirC expression with transglutaminase-like and TPR domain
MTYNNKGAILAETKRFDEAIGNYDRALALKPDYAEAYNNRGAGLLVLSHPDQALASFEQALALRPDYAEAINNKGTALQGLDRHQEALSWHERALALNPNNANAHLSIANAYLALGNYEAGWAEYEWRWGTKDLAPFRKDWRCPPWTGDQPLEHKSILLYAEQGYGDMVQFARYVPMVAGRGARVMLEVPRPLQVLFGSLEGVSQLICRGDKLPASDFHCPLRPALFARTFTIPAETPYCAWHRTTEEVAGTPCGPQRAQEWTCMVRSPLSAQSLDPAGHARTTVLASRHHLRQLTARAC